VHRMHSPIKNVQILDVNMPVDARILQTNVNYNNGFCSPYIDFEKSKRVFTTKHLKSDQSFIMELEVKNFDQKSNIDTKLEMYNYFIEWLLSQGNKDALIIRDFIDTY